MWVIINGSEHIQVKDFEEAVKLLDLKVKEESPSEIKMITLEEYKNWSGKKTKRGKRSK